MAREFNSNRMVPSENMDLCYKKLRSALHSFYVNGLMTLYYDMAKCCSSGSRSTLPCRV